MAAAEDNLAKSINSLSVQACRCAPNISEDDAKELQTLIDAGAPPTATPSQVIVGGPIGSGRTSMAAGIGTEFAFKQHKVRYLGLDALLEFATTATERNFPDDHGPATISYWPWSQSQVVIIDGVGPVVSAAEDNREANVAQFTAMLKKDLASVSGILKQCHTIWVLGDLRPPPPRDELSAVLDDFAKAVARYCESETPAFVVELARRRRKKRRKATYFPRQGGGPRHGCAKRAPRKQGLAGFSEQLFRIGDNHAVKSRLRLRNSYAAPQRYNRKRR